MAEPFRDCTCKAMASNFLQGQRLSEGCKDLSAKAQCRGLCLSLFLHTLVLKERAIDAGNAEALNITPLPSSSASKSNRRSCRITGAERMGRGSSEPRLLRVRGTAL